MLHLINKITVSIPFKHKTSTQCCFNVGVASQTVIQYLVNTQNEMIWNESGFRPPLCTYRLNWARRTSWGWWDDWDDTVLQTQDSKFEPWRSEAEHATSRSRRLPTILTSTRGWGRNIFCFFQTAETGNRTPNFGVKGSGANHYPRAPALVNTETSQCVFWALWIRFKLTNKYISFLSEKAQWELLISEIWSLKTKV